MVRTRKQKSFIYTLVILACVFLSVMSISAKSNENPLDYNVYTDILPTTNFFAQEEDQRKAISYSPDRPLEHGYQLIKENENFIFYLEPMTVGIAIYDKNAEYLWYSSVPDYQEQTYPEAVKLVIGSGVSIECFESSDSDLPVLTKYSGSQTDCTKTIFETKNGCEVQLDFIIGISFRIAINLTNEGIDVKMLNSSLEEKPYQTSALKFPKQYKLKSITFFPYLGSENYRINAYAFIPDGSGALIRYSDEIYETALIRRVYGVDLGIQNITDLNNHIRNQQVITLPIYGINHGYQQAAVFVEIKNGAGAAELHSYPYMYDNINLNRTFFRFLARDKFFINMNTGANSTIGLINDDI
ncbi:MAG: DUF5696 domain-containing protein, partial [Bacilli bacterium]|nr:DUF5696 domain-containing protein [Bacilli bacterium]